MRVSLHVCTYVDEKCLPKGVMSAELVGVNVYTGGQEKECMMHLRAIYLWETRATEVEGVAPQHFPRLLTCGVIHLTQRPTLRNIVS